MIYRFDTMTTEQFNEKDMDNFENYFDHVWISKKPFTVQLDSKDVELHLFIEHLDMSECIADCNTQEVLIGVIPSFNSLTNKYKQTILSQYKKENQDSLKANQKALLYDIILYGFSLTLHTDTTQDINEVDHLIKSAIAVSTCVNSLIGFELDRMCNGIGNTGWDFLSEYCEGVDLLQLAKRRIE